MLKKSGYLEVGCVYFEKLLVDPCYFEVVIDDTDWAYSRAHHHIRKPFHIGLTNILIFRIHNIIILGPQTRTYQHRLHPLMHATNNQNIHNRPTINPNPLPQPHFIHIIYLHTSILQPSYQYPINTFLNRINFIRTCYCIFLTQLVILL